MLILLCLRLYKALIKKTCVITINKSKIKYDIKSKDYQLDSPFYDYSFTLLSTSIYALIALTQPSKPKSALLRHKS